MTYGRRWSIRRSSSKIQSRDWATSMAFLTIVVAFAARALLVMLFLPFSALDKLLNFKAAVGQADEATSSRMLATVLIFAGFCVEVLMSVAILTGIADRMLLLGRERHALPLHAVAQRGVV